MPENLLQRGQRATAIQPLARERVAHLMNVEALDARQLANPFRKRAR
jgi:hypothetical protein